MKICHLVYNELMNINIREYSYHSGNRQKSGLEYERRGGVWKKGDREMAEIVGMKSKARKLSASQNSTFLVQHSTFLEASHHSPGSFRKLVMWPCVRGTGDSSQVVE